MIVLSVALLVSVACWAFMPPAISKLLNQVVPASVVVRCIEAGKNTLGAPATFETLYDAPHVVALDLLDGQSPRSQGTCLFEFPGPGFAS